MAQAFQYSPLKTLGKGLESALLGALAVGASAAIDQLATGGQVTTAIQSSGLPVSVVALAIPATLAALGALKNWVKNALLKPA